MAEATSTATPPPQAPANRRVGPLGILARVVGGLLLLVFLAWLILYITKGRFLKPHFERIVSESAGRQVRVASDFQLYFDPITIKFVADGLSVGNPDWRARAQPRFFVSKHILARIRTWPLVRGRREVAWLELDGGGLDLAWDAGRERNTWTFDKPGGSEPFAMPAIERARITGTRIDYLDPLLVLNTAIRVETVNATDARVGGDIRFTGDGTMRAETFTMTGSLLSPDVTVRGGENKLRLAARSGPTSLDVSGTLPGAFVLEDSRLKLVARGPNVARLFDFLGVAVPDTRAYRATSDLTRQDTKWKLTNLRGVFGASDIAGSVTAWLPNDRLKIDADLRTRKLDIIDASPFLGYDPNAVARGGVVRRVGGTPRLLPNEPIDVAAMKRFDADVRYRVATVRAPSLPVSNIDLTLDLDRGRMRLSPLTMNVAGGTLSSDITINARKRPTASDYDIRLSPTPMGRLLAGFGTEQAGTSGTIRARVRMSGTGDSLGATLASSNGRIALVMPRGTFWTRNVQLAELDLGTFAQKMFEGKLKEPVQINCGLIGFSVRSGVAAADPILIDTTKNVMLGRGGFSFRDESVDLAFRADSKKFSVLAGQSPVGINGYFAKPGYRIVSPELIGRGGAAVGLAVLASPFAAVLAFTDVGDAKSTQCGPVLAGARASAQRTTEGERRDDVGRGTTSKKEDGKPRRKKFLGIF